MEFVKKEISLLKLKGSIKNMIGVNEIQVNVYCVRRNSDIAILVDEEIYDEFDTWMSYYSDDYFRSWCEENGYDIYAEDWDDIRDNAYHEFYCEDSDRLWENFEDDCIIATRTIDRKLW